MPVLKGFTDRRIFTYPVRLPAKATRSEAAIMPAAISKNLVLLLYMDCVPRARIRTHAFQKHELGWQANLTSQMS